jgi:serine/threonine protein kinase
LVLRKLLIGHDDHHLAAAAAGVVIVVVVLLAVGLLVYVCIQRRRRNGYGYKSSLRKRKSQGSIKEVMSSIMSQQGKLAGLKDVHVFTFKELEKATENFADHLILGIGGFGTVYKGTLKNGMVHVAIKISNHVSTSGKKQLLNEVTILSQLNHHNLVTLYGCCLETEVPILVYEYIPNGNLYEHLHRLRFGVNLNWSKRLQIAAETAEALAYLHFAAFPPIYHRDVKTANILLDNTFTVKVADFGISRLVNPGKSHVSTAVQGTPGYLDPEYFHSYHLTDKSDVFSFGVVLLELLTSQKPLDYKRELESHSLAAFSIPYIKNGKLDQILDPQLKDVPAADFQLMFPAMQSVAELAANCLANKRKDRPTMKDVVEDLYSIKAFGKRQAAAAATS